MALNSLRLLLAPPLAPVGTPTDSEWRIAEEELGVAIPGDYKQFMTEYGAGCIDGFLWTFTPTIRNPHLNLCTQLGERSSALRLLRDRYGWNIPYAIYPDANGMIPWARTDNGDTLYWARTTENYFIVVEDSRAPEWDEFALSTVEFLEKLLIGEISVSMFPDSWPHERHEFRPATVH